MAPPRRPIRHIGWHAEVNDLVALVTSLPSRRTLDVACGTGFLTRFLGAEGLAEEIGGEPILDGDWFVAAVSARR